MSVYCVRVYRLYCYCFLSIGFCVWSGRQYSSLVHFSFESLIFVPSVSEFLSPRLLVAMEEIKLKQAMSLYEQGYITEEDYNKFKEKILEQLFAADVATMQGSLQALAGKVKEKKKKKKRVAVLGGSFDPITDGHLKMAAEVIHMNLADEVWITPCGGRPDKPSLKTTALNRYLMCQLAVNNTFTGDFPVKVCAFELGKPKAYPTVDLLQELDRKFPDLEIKFVVGSDLLESIPTWERGGPNELPWYRTRQIIVISRPGATIPHEWAQGGNVSILNSVSAEGKVISVNVSSSEVRKRMTSMNGSMETLLFGQSTRRVEGLLPLPVSEHINKYMLLHDSKPAPHLRRSESGSSNDGVLKNFSNVKLNNRTYNVTVERSKAPYSRRRVAVFGGVFDPITDGHLKMAAEVLHANQADEVWLVPCGPRPDLPDLMTAPLDRFVMCHLAVHSTFSGNFPIKVSAIEIFERTALTAPTLLRKFSELHPDRDFYFLIGSDLVKEVPLWAGDEDDKDWYKTQNFLLIPRPFYDVPETWEKRENVVLLSSPLADGEVISTNSSSSEVRRRMALPSAGLGIPLSRRLEGLVPLSVILHIIRYQLYTESSRDLVLEIGEINEELMEDMAKRSLSSTTSPIIRTKADCEIPPQMELVGVSPQD